MRRKDWIAGAAGVGGLVAAHKSEAALVGARRALASSKKLGVNLLVNPSLANNAAGWEFYGVTITPNGPGGANAVTLSSANALGGYYGIFQTVALIPGAAYVAGVWANALQQLTGSASLEGGSELVYSGVFLNHGSIGYVKGWVGTYSVNNTLIVPSGVTSTNIALQFDVATIAASQYSYISQPYFARIA